MLKLIDNDKLLKGLIESEQDTIEGVLPDLCGHYLLQYSALNASVIRQT